MSTKFNLCSTGTKLHIVLHVRRRKDDEDDVNLVPAFSYYSILNAVDLNLDLFRGDHVRVTRMAHHTSLRRPHRTT